MCIKGARCDLLFVQKPQLKLEREGPWERHSTIRLAGNIQMTCNRFAVCELRPIVWP